MGAVTGVTGGVDCLGGWGGLANHSDDDGDDDGDDDDETFSGTSTSRLPFEVITLCPRPFVRGSPFLATYQSYSTNRSAPTIAIIVEIVQIAQLLEHLI